MPSVSSERLPDQLAALRTELVEQAFTLERQGRLDAADVAISLAHRLDELSAAASAPAQGP
jgi:HPt (histidine-containing phosphotransfer) domain-containing protein